MAYVDFPINSALDRLAYDEYRQSKTLFGQMWAPAIGAGVGVGTITLRNFAFNKPVYTGLWKAAFTVPLFVYIGVLARDYREEKSRVKWAKIRHYIELHPEDFPKYPPRAKIGDTLQSWIPMRSGW